MLTRRQFLYSAAVLTAAQSLAWAPVPAAAQAPGFFRLSLGAVRVTALLDGAGLVRSEILHGLPPERLAALLAEAGLDPKAGEPIPINAFLLEIGDSRILVDAGGGSALGPRAGRLPANLQAAGCAPDEVDSVLLTHMHPDHALGLLAPDGGPLFPKAVVRPSAAEAASWLADATLAAAPEQRKGVIQALRGLAAAYGDRWRPFGPDEAPAPAVAAEPLPGHTPGHCGFRVRSQGQSLLAFGDIVHSAAVQFAHPEVTIDFDTDQAAAGATRLALLPRLAREGCLVAGAHLPFPGLGTVQARGAGLAWRPVEG